MSAIGRPSRVHALLVLLVLPFPPGAIAADADQQRDLTSMSLEELARTKVSSVSKTDEPRFRTPAAVQVVTAEDIRRAGATSIVEALRLAPGVHVARINSNQWAVGIRGFTSRLARSQLALMDGRSLYTPLFAGTYWETQDTLLEDVERIEIVRGPGGTLWGANAVSGIVNIITRNTRDTQGWFVSAGGGNEERAFLRARYGGAIADKGSYRVYGKYFRRDAAFHATTGADDAWHMAQGGFRTDWKLRGGDRLTVQGDAYSGRAGERTTLSFYERPFLRTVERRAPLSGGNVAARWAHVMNGSALTVNTYYDRTNRAEPNFQEARDSFELDLQHQFGVGQNQRVVWGLGYRLSNGRSQGVETVAFIPPDRTDHIFSAFVHDEIGLVKDRLRLSVGTKLERNQFTGFELQPSARTIWAPGPRHAVWSAVSRAVRTPSRLERDLLLTVALSPTAPLFARISGNEGFTSEKTWAYEAGYRVQPADRLSLEAAAFHNRYGDLTSLEQDRPFVESGRQVLPFRFANMLRGRSSGVEVNSLAHLTTRWRIGAEYSYLSLRLETRPGSTDTSSVASAGSSPRHMARAQSSWSLPGHVDLDVGFRWVDRLPSSKVSAYSELDARAAWLVAPRLELAVVGQNLLHKHHPEFGGSPEPTEIERSVYGEARWRW
jgi:iron complex outermembrane receptor protein